MSNAPMALDLDPNAPDWPRLAALAILELAHERDLFTADDLRDRVPPAPHPSLVGNAFKAARLAGVIRPMGYDMSRSPSRKFGVVRVWSRRIQREELEPCD